MVDTKVAIVTGATGSIGHKIVEYLVREHFKVVAIARNTAKLKALQGLFSNDIDSYSVDLTSSKEIHDLFNQLSKKYDSINVLVNCAGGGPLGGVQEITDEVWEENMQLKLLGYIRMSREVIPLMKRESYGRIINIVGTFGKQPSPFFAVGSVTNAALLSFTKELSLELEETGITVNAINPGAVKSLLWSNTVEEIMASGNKNIQFLASPDLKLTLPKEIARAVMYLVDSESQSTNGVSIYVDNGAYAGF